MIPLHPATFVAYTLAVLTGFGFGFVLERAGFGSARKLAAQFYLKDMTVLKVMFTAIVTAMLGLTLLRAAGFVDYDALWVNPTFLGAQVAGGLLFGAGFVIGGYCPGTSIVALASGRLDGLVFLLGTGAGILAYAGVYPRIADFAQRGGRRLLLTDWLHLPYGVVALGVTVLAVLFFVGGEYLERRFNAPHNASTP
ncbi:MAG: sulfurtransferase [Myxococcaceae bacterium]|nr:MAG: sulfurtransferase [Myxococcaceae bacterium]